MLLEEVPATNEAGVEVPAVQFWGEGMESVEQRERVEELLMQSQLNLKAVALSWTCYTHTEERAIAPYPGLGAQTGEKKHSQCVLPNSCRYGRKSRVWNSSCFSSGNSERGMWE